MDTVTCRGLQKDVARVATAQMRQELYSGLISRGIKHEEANLMLTSAARLVVDYVARLPANHFIDI